MIPNSLEAHTEVDFWSKAQVGDPDVCWEWTGEAHKGRAVYRVGGGSGASRTAYALYYERHPGKMLVLHSCDNGMCVNPAHLSLGTTQDNIADKVSKGRQARGSMFGKSDLTDEKVHDILTRYVDRERTTSIAARYGICSAMVSDIAARQSWKHVPFEREAELLAARVYKRRYAKPCRISEDQVREAERRYSEGCRYEVIATELGCHAKTLQRRVRLLKTQGG
jgi:hypothetical protein